MSDAETCPKVVPTGAKRWDAGDIFHETIGCRLPANHEGRCDRRGSERRVEDTGLYARRSRIMATNQTRTGIDRRSPDSPVPAPSGERATSLCCVTEGAACGGFASSEKDVTDENRANARLIVRAVNSHERLVEALRKIAGMQDKTLIAPSLGEDADQAHQFGANRAFGQAAEIARAALAAAEGDET